MVFTKDRKTRSLFDQWSYLGPKRRRLMNKSWGGPLCATVTLWEMSCIFIAWINLSHSIPPIDRNRPANL
jgi:hypothetical protein